MDKVDAVFMAVRNRLPGLDTSEWADELQRLGQLIARTVIEVHTGEQRRGKLTADDLIYLGMAEEVAHLLLPQASPAEGYVELWRRFEAMRGATRQLAAPPVVEALPEPHVDQPRRVDMLGQLGPILFGPSMVTLDQANARLPRVSEVLQQTMSMMAALRAQQRAIADLDAAGWSNFVGAESTELVFGHPGMGVLVLAGAESRRRTVQATLDRIVELGQPYIQVVLDRGVQPVRVANRTTDAGRACWAIDGVPQPPGRPLPVCIPESGGLAASMVRSLVGHLRARFLGLGNPAWAQCPACGSPRVEASRLEVERGRSTFVTDSKGEFASPTAEGRFLRLMGRRVDGTQVVGRILRCPDCHAARPFPNERPLAVTNLPRNMAGDPPPQGILELLQEQLNRTDPLPEEPIPEGIDQWLLGQGPGATSQFSDVRLQWRTAFRLPDSLVDLARSTTTHDGADSVWRDAVDRVGRDKARVLAWELRDLESAMGTAQKILLIGVEPDHVATQASQWFGPVEEWIEVMPGICWRGALVGSGGSADLLVVRDFLGVSSSFEGGGTDFEYLQTQLQKAAAVVYVGDGRTEWDEDGLVWAADEGRLCAFVAPAHQLEQVSIEEGERIDIADPEATGRLFSAIDSAIDPEMRQFLRQVRKVMDNIDASLPAEQMAQHLRTPELRSIAVHAELAGTAEAWFYLLDAILDALANEGIGASSDVRFRASVAGRRLAELGLPAVVTEKWWSLMEFHERTGVGKELVRWMQPIFGEFPDRMLLARVRAVAERMPDLTDRYAQLNELREAVQHRRRVHVRRPVLEFWWGVSAPAYWRASRSLIPDLLGLVPQAICGSPTVCIAGGPIPYGRRIASLITGGDATIDNTIPEPSVHTPSVVIEPANLDLVRLEARTTATNLTVIVSSHEPERWEQMLPPDSVVVPLSTALQAPSPSSSTLARRLRVGEGGDTAELAHLMHVTRVKKGSQVLRAGADVGGAAWIRSGEVQVGDQVLGAERLLCPEALFHHPVPRHDAVALTDVELDVFSLSALHVLLDGHRPLLRYIERACAVELALLLGPGALSDPWLTPTIRKPVKINAEWALYWPLVQRNGFHDIDAIEVPMTFRNAWAGEVATGDLLYAPGATSNEIMLVLEGELVVDDGVNQMSHGPGSMLGHFQLLPVHRAEKCLAARDTTVLMLGDNAEAIWASDHPAFRRAVLRHLRRAWHATAAG